MIETILSVKITWHLELTHSGIKDKPNIWSVETDWIYFTPDVLRHISDYGCSDQDQFKLAYQVT